MNILISGGCKNGKSSHAERLISNLRDKDRPLYYLATMQPHDGEDEARIARHQKSRAHLGFTTIEVGTDIPSVLDRCDKKGSFLLDSATALLANEMFRQDGSVDSDAHLRIAPQLRLLMQSVGNLVIVSDYLYSDCLTYDSFTEQYRRALAHLDKSCAKEADVVLEACAGTIFAHKGGELLEKIG